MSLAGTSSKTELWGENGGIIQCYQESDPFSALFFCGARGKLQTENPADDFPEYRYTLGTKTKTIIGG